MLKKQHTVAVVGLGNQAINDLIPAVQALAPNVKLGAVVEPEKSQLDSFLSKNPSIKGYENFDQFVKSEHSDFIILSAPHFCHYEITQSAIKNGIHVLKEKPLAVSLKEAKQIEKQAKKCGVAVSIITQRRFNPIYATLPQLLSAIGHPFYIEAKYTLCRENPGEGWRGRKKLSGGGCLLDMGYHMIDLLIWYFGLPNRVFSLASKNGKEKARYNVEDTAHVLFSYDKKGVWGSLFLSRVIPPKQEVLNVYGTHGTIHLERGLLQRLSCDGSVQEELRREEGWPSAYREQILRFLEEIEEGKQGVADNLSFHFNHLRFIEAAYQSMKTGRFIPLDAS